MSPAKRLGLVVLSLALSTMLVVAVALRPDPRGHGTHEQLGLPPCTFVAFFGGRCPSCGMTTSWAHLVRGNLRGALEANVGGALLAALAVAAVPWLVATAVRGRWLGFEPGERAALIVLAVIVLVTLIDWLVRIRVT